MQFVRDFRSSFYPCKSVTERINKKMCNEEWQDWQLLEFRMGKPLIKLFSLISNNSPVCLPWKKIQRKIQKYITPKLSKPPYPPRRVTFYKALKGSPLAMGGLNTHMRRLRLYGFILSRTLSWPQKGMRHLLFW